MGKGLSVHFRFSIIRLLAFAAFLISPVFAIAGTPFDEAAKSLPDQLGEFRARGPAAPLPASVFDLPPEDFGVIAHVPRIYISTTGHTILVGLTRTLNDSGAFSLLTRHRSGSEEIKLGIVGTAAIIKPTGIVFFRGRDFVIVTTEDKATTPEELMAFARALAATLDPSEDDIPVLVRHLPNWQTAQPWAHYAVSAKSLKQDVANQPIMDEVNFEGGTEAVVADYDRSRLLIIEFTTPQLAGDNDRRIAAKIQELRSAGQPVPSAYRRVGNYSVFVFNAPDEKTAVALIDQVKYEQVVQWLGEDPYWFEKVQRMYAQTTAGVLVAVIQSSGLSLLICLGIGGIFGVFLFRRRRAQQASAAYSDAGGMVRLNIDEMTTESKSQKLLGRGKS
jgi:hypothetical protein